MSGNGCRTVADMSDSGTRETTAEFAPLYLEFVRILNFRGLTSCEFELEPTVTLLVGRNNSGKSRILRALALGLGAQQAELDDLTVGGDAEATIDIVVAPPPPASPDDPEAFSDQIAQRLQSVQTLREEPLKERFAWRTTVRRSAEGLGARTEMQVLTFDSNTSEWVLGNHAAMMSRTQRQLFSADFVGTHRDLVDELTRRGSAVRRVLSDLEIEEATRAQLEAELDELNAKLTENSATLAAVQSALATMETLVGLGTPSLTPLPSKLEEVSQAIAFGLDTGAGPLPVRLHGSGARSLASLQVQGVLYERRLGADGPAIRPHPLTLIEEPEAHLHPQACLELSALLSSLRGQVVVSTHSAHLVSAVAPQSIRLIRPHEVAGDTRVFDLGPSRSDDGSVHRALRPATHVEEMEKLRRLVERPFGELVFASVLVLGDGATERAFLPIAIRHALGHRAHGVCVVDPQNISSDLGHAALKFANLVGIPWLIFCDTDAAGTTSAQLLLDAHAGGDTSRLIAITGVSANDEIPGAIERMLIEFDDQICRTACFATRPDLDTSATTLELMKRVKGSVGGALARGLVAKYPDPAAWPPSLVSLIKALDSLLTPQEAAPT